MRGAAFTLQAMRSRLNRVAALAMAMRRSVCRDEGADRIGRVMRRPHAVPCQVPGARLQPREASRSTQARQGAMRLGMPAFRTSARACLLRGADEIDFAVMRSFLRTLVQLATSPSAPTAAARQHRGWRQRDTADASHRRSASGSTTALDAIGVTTLSVSPRDAPNHCAHACSGTGSRTAPPRPANRRRTSARRRATRCCHRLACSNR